MVLVGLLPPEVSCLSDEGRSAGPGGPLVAKSVVVVGEVGDTVIAVGPSGVVLW